MQPMSIRTRLWDILHFGKGRAGHLFSRFLVVLILTSLAILPLEFVAAFEEYHGALVTIEVVLTVLFTVEYLLRLYAAPGRLRYVFSFFGIIDFFSILPFYLGFLGTQYVRVFRLARLIRLLKLSRIEAAAAVEKETASEVELLPGEHIEYVVSKHPIFLFLCLLPPLFLTSISFGTLFLAGQSPIALSFAVTLFLFTGIFLWKALLDYNYDVIYVTSHRLIFQNWHLFGREMNQVSYRSITNVKQRYMGILGYLLGFGSIAIETPAVAAGKIEHKLVHSHEKAAQCIMGKCFMEEVRVEGVPP